MALESIDPTALRLLERTPSAIRQLIETVPANIITKPLDEAWAIKDVVAHLLDTNDGVIVARMKRIVAEERPFIQSIDPTARLAAGGYSERSVESLLEELARQRVAGLDWLQSLTREQLARTGEHDSAGKISVLDIVHQWAYHDLMHLKQAESMLQAVLLERMGNTRLFYFDV